MPRSAVNMHAVNNRAHRSPAPARMRVSEIMSGWFLTQVGASSAPLTTADSSGS